MRRSSQATGGGIPDWRAHPALRCQFPSLAVTARPAARTPSPAAILEQARSWGVSCHKIEQQFDSGDVLRTLEFPLSSQEDHDSLDLKVQLASRQLASEIAGHFTQYWDGASSAQALRRLLSAVDSRPGADFPQSVELVLRRLRRSSDRSNASPTSAIRASSCGGRFSSGLSRIQVAPGTVIYVNSLA